MGTRRTRTPAAVSPLDAVMQLMAERTKYEQWLEDLEAKKESTPAKVFDRVRHDYLSRLQAVMDQLKQHASALEEHTANLTARLEQLEAAEDDHAETRAEAELRAQVGEMSESEWDTLSKRADREIAKLKQDQQLISADIKRIQDLLSDASGDSAKPAAAPKPADLDEMEFLKSVVGASSPAAGTPAPIPSAPVAGKASEPAVPVASKPAEPAKPAESPAATPTPSSGAPSQPPADAPSPAKETQRDTPIADGVLRTSGVVEQPKTLKCTECGAMNYPSEWYCERCGAELTVV